MEPRHDPLEAVYEQALLKLLLAAVKAGKETAQTELSRLLSQRFHRVTFAQTPPPPS